MARLTCGSTLSFAEQYDELTYLGEPGHRIAQRMGYSLATFVRLAQRHGRKIDAVTAAIAREEKEKQREQSA